MISRWCAGPPQVWKSLGATEADDEEFTVSPHDICVFQRRKGHDDPCHRYCCWGPEETESRDCTCECHQLPVDGPDEQKENT